MPIKIEGLEKLLKELSDILTRELRHDSNKALQVAASNQIDRILDRTEKGNKLNGGKFKPYSPSYKKQMEGGIKVGGQKRSKSPTPVNLTLTGNMLQSMQVTASGIGNDQFVEIGFVGAGEAAKASGNNEKREFFGISKKDEEQILKDIIKNLELFKK